MLSAGGACHALPSSAANPGIGSRAVVATPERRRLRPVALEAHVRQQVGGIVSRVRLETGKPGRAAALLANRGDGRGGLDRQYLCHESDSNRRRTRVNKYFMITIYAQHEYFNTFN